MNSKKWSILAGATIASMLWGPQAAVGGAALAERLHAKVTGEEDDELREFDGSTVEGRVIRE